MHRPEGELANIRKGFDDVREIRGEELPDIIDPFPKEVADAIRESEHAVIVIGDKMWVKIPNGLWTVMFLKG